jgi:hypothetical protein
MSLTREQASAFALLALQGIAKEYPNTPEHVLTRDAAFFASVIARPPSA